MKLNEKTLAGSAALVAAACMLLLSIAAALGVYTGAVEQMAAWHMFYTTDLLGTITGMLEAAVWTYLGVYAVAWLNNMMIDKMK